MSPRALIIPLAAVSALLTVAPAQAGRVLEMRPDGSVVARQDPHVHRAPAAERHVPQPSPRPAARAAARPRTSDALRELLLTGQIDQATHDRALSAFRRARKLAATLSGARAVAMRGVVSNMEGMAARGQVEPHRLPALVETLERNAQWWTTGSLLGSGARVSFSGSGIVWQHYPGSGLQIQWLATFGKANGLWADDEDNQFEDLLGESVALASDRAGGIAFEYLFPFGGGNPPWVSSLAQGTALSALSRGAKRFFDTAWADAARRAIGIFRVGPPEGVAQRTGIGTHYLQYSYAPRLRILNGFVQSLNGLFDYANILGDQEGWALFDAGRKRATHELPRYDTGGWSRYSNYTESTLAYHDLLRGFLAQLCTRLGKAGMNDQPFCKYAARFLLDMRQDPEVRFTGTGARAGSTARLRFRIDKPATVSVVIGAGSFSHRASQSVSSGTHSFSWRPPAAGSYSVSLSATDLAGNHATFTTTASVR